MVSKSEAAKDSAQMLVESGAMRVGRIVNIIVGAVREVATEVGGFATDAFEMREAAKRAVADDQPRKPLGDRE